MGYDGANNVTTGEEVKKEHYDQLLDNMIALASVPRLHTFSSIFNSLHDSVIWIDACEDRLEITGDELLGFTVKFIFMCKIVSGAARARIYNISTSSVVAGSTTPFSNAAADRKESNRLFLPAGVNLYKLQILTSTESDHAQVWDAAVRVGG